VAARSVRRRWHVHERGQIEFGGNQTQHGTGNRLRIHVRIGDQQSQDLSHHLVARLKANALQHRRQQVPERLLRGLRRNRGEEQDQRVTCTPIGIQGQREIVLRLGKVGTGRQRPFEQDACFRVLAEHPMHVAECVQKLGAGGRHGDGALQGFDGLERATAVMQQDTPSRYCASRLPGSRRSSCRYVDSASERRLA
jgi:hypothetical protein